MTSLDYKNLKSEEIIDRLGILNILKLNIYHTINLMFRVKYNTIPEALWQNFKQYSTITRQVTAKITLKNLK